MLLLASAPLRPAAPGAALLADIEGPIGPATSRFVDTVLDDAAARQAAVVILRMDTPGGLSDSMRDIIKSIMRSPVPVAVFVAPSGARAASAGTYILYASHVAAMAPGTNLGAATPVQIGDGLPLPGGDRPKRPDGKDEDTEPAADEPSGDAMKRKVVNDAVAYIRGLAELRGRNAEWAERAVREAASLPSREALDEGVIDLVARDEVALLAAMDGRRVEVLGADTVLRTAGLPVERIEPGWQTQLLAIITNPNVALILMMIGIYGLIFEFANPGTIGPGVVGVICLLLALYALNMLPLDYAGLGLLLVGVAFMVAEALTPSFGVLGVGGLIAFMLGASILIDSDSPAFRVSWYVIAGMGLASAAVLALVLGYALRAQRHAVTTGAVEITGEPATVIEWAGGEGYVRARGERWRARGEGLIQVGDRVDVTGMDGLMLHVAPRPSAHIGEST
jgi:membrane-bound serine protease (ClpP class)